MDREEWESLGVCAQCGASLAVGSERGFAFGVGNVICWNCAVERGGHYDADREAWSVPPDVADLPDEAYGSGPDAFDRPRR
ncbi:MAG: hypothetical protein MJE66_12435 [Proteobacteria bacterium]|nr:hypothetical protein [Pseudomonadota bacterium]